MGDRKRNSRTSLPDPAGPVAAPRHYNRAAMAPFHQEELRRTLVADLYRRSAATVWFLIPTLFLFRAIVRSAYDTQPSVRAAFWTTIAIVIVRLGVVLHGLRDASDEPRAVRRRYLRFHWMTVLMGAGIAATMLLAGPHVSFSQIALSTVFLTGVHSIALGSMAASPSTYVQYINPALLAILWTLLARPRGPQENILLALIFFYVPCLSIICYYAHGGLRRTILLGLELRDLALKDVLTGLRNRRFLTEFMGPEVEQIRRSWREPGGGGTRSVGLLLIDLDLFKSVNDEHGHGAGDEVLRQLAGVVQETVRRPDLVVRWGGEEFVVVARDLARDAVGDLAVRIRQRVEAHSFRLPSGDTLRLTCSIGFCLFPFSDRKTDLVGWEQALTLADHGLYEAKQTGRNRVVGVVSGEAEVDRGETLLRTVKDDVGGAVERQLIRLVPERGRAPSAG